MLAHEMGTCSGSDLFFMTPSQKVRDLLYYMTACGYYYTDHNYHIERDYYPEYLLCYICNGRLSVTCDGNTMVAGPQQVVLLNCHVPHEYHTIVNTEFVWLHFYGANTAQLAEHIIDLYGGHVFSTSCAQQIYSFIYALIYSCRHEQVTPESQLSVSIYQTLMALFNGVPRSARAAASQEDTSPERMPIVEQAMRFMGAHYREPLSVSDVAQEVNMSQSHFSRLFKKQSGYSPHEYIILIRLNRAKHLLKTTDLPVKNIAQEVGYQDVTTFTSAFTNRAGLSPSQFRRFPL